MRRSKVVFSPGMLFGIVGLVYSALQEPYGGWQKVIPQFGIWQAPHVPGPPSANEYAKKDARRHEFAFTRMQYTNCSDRSAYLTGKGWYTDYPKADKQLLIGIRRLLGIDVYSEAYALPIGPELMRHPFLYAVEPGQMCLSFQDVALLRGYLLRGGFIMFDDLWGTKEWEAFSGQMRNIFPEYPIEQLSLEHPIFHQHFDIDELVQIPNVGQAMHPGAPTFEEDGYEHRVYGIYDKNGRLMVVIFHNTDLGDAWEWAEDPNFPLKMSNYAYMAVVNVITYAMSH